MAEQEQHTDEQEMEEQALFTGSWLTIYLFVVEVLAAVIVGLWFFTQNFR